MKRMANPHKSRRLGAAVMLPAAALQILLTTASLSALTPVPATAQTVTAPAVTAPAVTAVSLNPSVKGDAPERQPGQKPVAKSLEAGMWVESEKVEVKAKTSGERNHDPALNTYINEVLDKSAGSYAGDVRLYIMDRPFFNASMAPNGYTEVWTGLLLRCQTEDELAFVLGHEAAHFRHSHSVRTYQAAKDSQNAALAASLIIAVVAAGAAANANSYQAAQNIGNIGSGLIDIVYLGAVASFLGYSRETESQADTYGLLYLKEAGYFTGSAADIWASRLDETAASDYDKVRKSPTRINIFGGHPLETERLSDLERQERLLNGGKSAERTVEDAKAARAAYRARIRPYLNSWLREDLRRQDYGQTLWLAERMRIDGEDAGLLNFYSGEAYRLRGGRGADGSDLENAVHAYKKALEQPDAPKETNRQLGDVFRRLGNTKEAIDAFTAYLAAAPDASDAWMVQDQIDTLKQSIPQPAAAPETPAATSNSAPPATDPAPAATPTSGGTTQ